MQSSFFLVTFTDSANWIGEEMEKVERSSGSLLFGERLEEIVVRLEGGSFRKFDRFSIDWNLQEFDLWSASTFLGHLPTERHQRNLRFWVIWITSFRLVGRLITHAQLQISFAVISSTSIAPRITAIARSWMHRNRFLRVTHPSPFSWLPSWW